VIPPDYLVLRLARRYLPERLARAAIRRQVLLSPGLETRDPAAAADRYQQALERYDHDLSDMAIFILGYGGYFGVAVALLELGARHVTLCDPYAEEHHGANSRLANQAPKYLEVRNGNVRPNPEWITLLPMDVRSVAEQQLSKQVDLVISWSVYEHLVDPNEVTAALVEITSPGGCNLHFIDLRDHYFRHPFEMLCHRERVWRTWLNPASNLNRWRIWQYQEVFERHFGSVYVEALERDLGGFHRVRNRIRPKFLSGDELADSVTRLMVFAKQPIVGA
jgi:hypothetical protein